MGLFNRLFRRKVNLRGAAETADAETASEPGPPDWEKFVALYSLKWTIERPDLGGFATYQGGAAPEIIPELSCQLLEEGYDSPSLRIAAGENWQSPGITDLFDKALHEIGFLPIPRSEAALILIERFASGVASHSISEYAAIRTIWAILAEAPDLHHQAPFDEIRKMEQVMDSQWPYYEEHNIATVQRFAQQILARFGKECEPRAGAYRLPPAAQP